MRQKFGLIHGDVLDTGSAKSSAKEEVRFTTSDPLGFGYSVPRISPLAGSALLIINKGSTKAAITGVLKPFLIKAGGGILTDTISTVASTAEVQYAKLTSLSPVWEALVDEVRRTFAPHSQDAEALTWFLVRNRWSIESSFQLYSNPYSSAKGVGQVIDGTVKGLIAKWGTKFGLKTITAQRTVVEAFFAVNASLAAMLELIPVTKKIGMPSLRERDLNSVPKSVGWLIATSFYYHNGASADSFKTRTPEVQRLMAAEIHTLARTWRRFSVDAIPPKVDKNYLANISKSISVA